jgi:hypothetical protein
MSKICTICGECKSINEFPWRSKAKGTTRNQCKPCFNLQDRKWRIESGYDKKMYEKHIDKRRKNARDYASKEENKQKRYESHKKWLEANKDKENFWSDLYQKRLEREGPKIKEYMRQWRKDNKEDINQKSIEYIKSKKESNPFFKAQQSLRGRMQKAFKNGYSKSKRSLELIGCPWEELKAHIENKFVNGMTWENYGLFGWHIDHIIPFASAKTIEELEKLCHYTNLQPLWAEDNLKKGAS